MPCLTRLLQPTVDNVNIVTVQEARYQKLQGTVMAGIMKWTGLRFEV
jgi:hypothetical protein